MITPKYLHGLHDAGGEYLMQTRPGWVVITEAIGADPQDLSGRDYARLADLGLGVIVRLNHGYGPDGTIPRREQYEAFAERVSNFIRASRGCGRWIIGNEPNHAQERPQGQAILPAHYAQCFNLVWGAVRSWAQPDGVQLIPAAVAPWNDQTGDWCEYQREMLTIIGGRAGGICLHTGTHGPEVERITSEARMDAPYAERRFEFHAYQDLLEYVPAALRHLPVYITEANQGDPWANRETGWIQAAYLDIARWNNEPQPEGSRQKIDCLCLYRWSRDDRWSLQDKPAVIDAFKAAVNAGWRGPETRLAARGDTKMFLPAVHGGDDADEPANGLPAREWDEDLDRRGVTLETYTPKPGESYWRLVRAEYRDAQMSGGRHHIYVDVLDAAGERVPGVDVLVQWADGEFVIVTETKPGEEAAANFPMYAAGRAYTARVAVGPSDGVAGLGLGSVEQPSMGIHVSYLLVWQWVTAPATTLEIPESPVVATPLPGPTRGAAINPKVAEAIADAEAGRAFDAEGRLVIRFEAHIFLQRAKEKRGGDFFRTGDPVWTGQQYRPGYGADWRDIHTGRQADEYDAFLFAVTLDEMAAYESISMGATQTMGFHFARLGYASAQEMFEAYERSVAAQMVGFANFVLADAQLLAAINGADWPVIGERYNGSAAAGGAYRAAYERLWGG